jgi:hypothetical protein
MGTDEIHRELAVIKCNDCGSIFDLLPRPEVEIQSPPKPSKREKVELPEKYKISRNHDALEISWRWYNHGYIGLAFFCLSWDSFLVFWYYLAFVGDEIAWAMVIFPVAFVAVGVFLTYWTLAGLLNRTVLSATTTQLSIRHRPLPWFGNKKFPSDGLSQLFVKEFVRSRSDRSLNIYDLMALGKGGRRLKLLSKIEKVEQALYLEQEIEEHLGIRDRQVPGDYTI